jgi:hypothetical protein
MCKADAESRRSFRVLGPMLATCVGNRRDAGTPCKATRGSAWLRIGLYGDGLFREANSARADWWNLQ